jgi:lactoylglutathione lyase
MKRSIAVFEKAFGYQDDKMNLPVADLAAAVPFYETVLGFRVVSRVETPHRKAVLSRDQVEIGLAENGGDASQDGCAFHVKNLDALVAELNAAGFDKKLPEIGIEDMDGEKWRVLYLIAPDGLCFWLGERQG